MYSISWVIIHDMDGKGDLQLLDFELRIAKKFLSLMVAAICECCPGAMITVEMKSYKSKK